MTSVATSVQYTKTEMPPIISAPRFIKPFATNWKQDIDDWTTNKGPVRVLATIAVAATTALKNLANLFIRLANAIYSSFYTHRTATPIETTLETKKSPLDLEETPVPIEKTLEPKDAPEDLNVNPVLEEIQTEITPPIATQIIPDFSDNTLFPPLSNQTETPRESLRAKKTTRFVKPKTQGELKRERRMAALAAKSPTTQAAVLKEELIPAPELTNGLQLQVHTPTATAVRIPLLVFHFPAGELPRLPSFTSFTIPRFPAPAPQEMLDSPQLPLAIVPHRRVDAYARTLHNLSRLIAFMRPGTEVPLNVTFGDRQENLRLTILGFNGGHVQFSLNRVPHTCEPNPMAMALLRNPQDKTAIEEKKNP